MCEESKEIKETSQEQSNTQPVGGIKGFFKRVRDSLEKFDKKVTETMDNDPNFPPLFPDEPQDEPTVELKEEIFEDKKDD